MLFLTSYIYLTIIVVFLCLHKTASQTPLIEPLSDDALSATSYYATQGLSTPNRASYSYPQLAWCPATTSDSEYLEVDLGAVKEIGSMGTKGRIFQPTAYTTAYYLLYSIDGVDYTTYSNILNGNSDASIEQINTLESSIFARYLRFKASTYDQWPCMQVEAYSAPSQPSSPTTPSPSSSPTTPSPSSSPTTPSPSSSPTTPSPIVVIVDEAEAENIQIGDELYFQFEKEIGDRNAGLKAYIFDEITGVLIDETFFEGELTSNRFQGHMNQFTDKIAVILWHGLINAYGRFALFNSWGCSCYPNLLDNEDIQEQGYAIFTFIGTISESIIPDWTFCSKYDKLKDVDVSPKNIQLEITFPVENNGNCSNEDNLKITIHPCDAETMNRETDKLYMQLKGTDGLTDIFYLGEYSDAWPAEFSVANVFNGKDIGDLYSILIGNDDSTDYCVGGIALKIPPITLKWTGSKSFEFRDEFFTASKDGGIVFTSNCDNNYKYVDGYFIEAPYMRCMDEPLELYLNNGRGLYSVDIHTCVNDASDITSQTQQNVDLYLSIMGKPFGANTYSTTDIIYLDSMNDWSVDEHRIFQVNDAIRMEDITLVSIGTNGVSGSDNIVCIDSISIKSYWGSGDSKYVKWDSVLYLSDNWIDSSTTSIYGIFKYPVCGTEVVGVTIDYDNSIINVDPQDSTISGLTCINNNKIISSTCSISQSYELSKVTSFSIVQEDSSTSEYSWGHASSIMKGITNSESVSTTDEFSWGLNQQLTVSADAGVLFANYGVELSVGANQQWTSGTETSSSTDKTTQVTTETNEQQTVGNTFTNAKEASYETVSTNTIACSGEINVPPSHSIEYSLIFSSINTTMYTYTDLKITLCSAFIQKNDDTDDQSNYIYLNKIPGILFHQETTSCNVDFQSVEYLTNDLTCAQEQKLAHAAGSNYVPKCNDDDPKLYDKCQCDIGDSLTLGQCWCSDETGNMIDGTLTYVRENESDQELCENTCN